MATIIGYGSKHNHQFTLDVNEIGDPDIVNNTTAVQSKFSLYLGSWSWSGWNSIIYSYTINGTTYNGTIPNYNAGEVLVIRTETQTINHNEDGSKTIDFSFTVTDNSGQTYTCGNASASGSMTLTTIPRASTVSCTTTNIGETATININRASDNFTHTLLYEFGSLSGTIYEKTPYSILPFIIPTSFYSQIPNDKMGVGTLRCITYNGNTEIGRTATLFYVSTNELECKPTLSTNVVDTNPTTIALTGDSSKLIKYCSTARVTITANARNSSTLVSKTVNGENITGTIKDFLFVSTNVFNTIATDSRGYSTIEQKTLNMIDYIPLTLNAMVKRPEPTTGEVSITFSGNYYNGNFSTNEANTLSLSWEYKENGTSTWINGGTLTPVINGNSYSNGNSEISLGNNFDYQKGYDFHIVVQDRIKTQEVNTNVTMGIPVFNWAKDYFNVMGQLRIKGLNVNDRIIAKNLYRDNTGSTGNITLGLSINDFDYLEIFYLDTISGNEHSAKIDISSSTNFTIEGMAYNNNVSTNYVTNYQVSGTSLNVSSYASFSRDYSSGNIVGDISNKIKIIRIIGGKI